MGAGVTGRRACRDGLGGCIGLLGGDTALLDREGCSIAGGVHVLETGYLAVLVNGDEAGRVAGQARHGPALELCERDDAIDLDRGAWAEVELAIVDLLRVGARLESYPAVREQVAQHAAGRRAEHAKWIFLGSNDGELDAYDASVGQVRGGQQRELIQRERPAEPGGCTKHRRCSEPSSNPSSNPTNAATLSAPPKCSAPSSQSRR